MSRIIGTLLKGFGPTSGGGVGDPPTVPTLTAVDNGDGTVTFTIASSSTGSANSIYVTDDVENNWTLEGSRSGNGNVSASLSAGRYFAYVSSVLNSQSAVSLVHLIRVGVNSDASLSHSPADVLRYLLIDLGGGTLPSASGSWPIHVANEPDSPDNVITCYDTSGLLQGRIGPSGEMVEFHGVQIRIRSTTFPVGYAKANALKVLIDETIRRDSIMIGSSEYLVHTVTRQGGIANVGKAVPTLKLNLFTLNVVVKLRQTI